MRRTREQWAALIAAFETTSQPATRFCERRGISPRTFAWWRWRLRDTARGAYGNDDVKLLAVDVVAEERARSGSPITIVLEGLELRVDVGADVDYIAALVARLRA